MSDVFYEEYEVYVGKDEIKEYLRLEHEEDECVDGMTDEQFDGYIEEKYKELKLEKSICVHIGL